MVFFLFLIILAASYLKERKVKEIFHKANTSQTHLENFKNVMTYAIPIPIIVLTKKNDKFIHLFSNAQYISLFFGAPLSLSSGRRNTYQDTISSDNNTSNNSEEKPNFYIGKVLDLFILDNRRKEIPREDHSNSNSSLINEESMPLTPNYIALKEFLNECWPAQKNRYIKLEGYGYLNPASKKQTFFEITLSKIDWEGEMALIICLNDIGSFKMVDKYKNRILATVSHNLRTPLFSSIANLEASLDEIKEKQIRNKIKLALNSNTLLLYSINDILDYAKFCEKKLVIRKSTVNLCNLIEKV